MNPFEERDTDVPCSAQPIPVDPRFLRHSSSLFSLFLLPIIIIATHLIYNLNGAHLGRTEFHSISNPFWNPSLKLDALSLADHLLLSILELLEFCLTDRDIGSYVNFIVHPAWGTRLLNASNGDFLGHVSMGLWVSGC